MLQLGAAGDQQRHHNNVPAHASPLMPSILGKKSSHPGDLAPLQPRFGTLRLLAFPKTKKLPLKGKSPQTVNEIQENMME